MKIFSSLGSLDQIRGSPLGPMLIYFSDPWVIASLGLAIFQVLIFAMLFCKYYKTKLGDKSRTHKGNE